MLHQVGAGTLGPVFRAYDADRARLVAVKVLRLDVPPERLHQLVAELERLIAAEVAHPVVAAPIATGTDGLVIYLAQEYVPADSLDVVLRDEGPPVPADALRVAAQLAGALDFAAARNVHHGVLHPRDVLMSQDDTRLTGLGVAGAIEKIGVAAPRRRPYTAPERMAGAAWDRRADIFSLAALIHEMLWGRRLTAIGTEAANALTNLPGADLTRLKAAFARALAPDPADRFEIAMDFASALSDAFPHVASAGVGRGLQTAPQHDFRNGLEGRSGHQSGDLLSGLDTDGAEDGLQTRAGDGLQTGVADGLELGVRDGLPPSREASADRRSLGGGGQTVPEYVLRPDDLELRAAEDARYDVDVAPTMGWEPTAEATILAAAPAQRVTPLEELPLTRLRDGLDDDAGSAGLTSSATTDTRQTVAAPPPRSPLFQPDEVDAPERLDGQDEPDERAPSLMAPVAAALIAGLALGFAGGYLLGGRRATSSVASALPATAPSRSADAKARGEREFTEAAVSDANTVGLSPSPLRGVAGTGKPDTTSNTGKKGTPAAAATAPGRLLVRSTPAGARVFVDGREQGQTPATIKELARGNHRVRVVRDGYVAEERRIAITTGQPSASMTVELKRSRAPEAARRAGSPAPPATAASIGALSVDSRPAGARVFLDGQLVGTTPLSLPQIGEGEHAVRLEREGYRRWSSSVRVAGGQRQRVAASLER